jgi:hypothetical protein
VQNSNPSKKRKKKRTEVHYRVEDFFLTIFINDIVLKIWEKTIEKQSQFVEFLIVYLS